MTTRTKDPVAEHVMVAVARAESFETDTTDAGRADAAASTAVERAAQPMSSTATPIAGPRFKAALALKGLDRNDRKLLALLGAFADAGEHRPPVKELARRLGVNWPEVDQRLERLSKRRLIWVDWSPYRRFGDATPKERRRWRNRYTLLFAGDELPEHGVRRIERATRAKERRPSNLKVARARHAESTKRVRGTGRAADKNIRRTP